MTREQVIKGLECCASLDGGGCAVCDWADPEEYECFSNLGKAALELLKEQTSVKPVKSKLSWEHGYNWDIWDCGHCGSQLRSDANYCDRCGHKVNWDDMEENDT